MLNITQYRDKAFIEARVVKVVRVPELGECWEWAGARTSRGYGHFGVVIGDKQRFFNAHRAAYEIFTGNKLGALEATHRCDNASCCNPGHIVPGTHQENMTDMRRKGRAVGHAHASNPNAKLTAELVAEIRSSDDSLKSLAAKYRVSTHHIWGIRSGKYWPAQAAA